MPMSKFQVHRSYSQKNFFEFLWNTKQTLSDIYEQVQNLWQIPRAQPAQTSGQHGPHPKQKNFF